MAKQTNGGGKAKNDKTPADYDQLRRLSKVGKNKSKPAQPRPIAVSPMTLIKTFDAKDQIVTFALASKAMNRLRVGSPSRQIADLMIEFYGKEERRSGSKPAEWHIMRCRRAIAATEDFMGRKWLMMNQQAFDHGIRVAKNALDSASANIEISRSHELKDLEYRKFSVENIIERFTPPPAVEAEVIDENEMVAV